MTRRILGAVAAAFAFCLAIPTVADAQGRPALFGGRSPAHADALPQAHSRGLARQRDVAPDIGLMQQVRAQLERSPGTAVEIDIPVFQDTSYTVSFNRVERTSKGTINYFGTVVGVPLSSATFVLSHGLLAGSIHVDNRAFQILAVGNKRYQVLEVDRSLLQDHPDGMPTPEPVLPKSLAVPDVPVAQADDGSTIDLMVVWTPQARAGASPGNTADTAPILSQIDLAVAATNLAYSNSGVVQRLRLVHAEEVAYNDSANMSLDLDRITNTTNGVIGAPDGYMDGVGALRDAYGADAVSLWVEDGGPGIAGLGWLMATVGNSFAGYAYNIVRRDQASSNQTLAHELGHNMGLRHDNYMDNLLTPYAWAHGYVDLTNRFRTVMAYNNQCANTPPNTSCQRIDNFSSPLNNFNGAVTGNAANADAARVLNDTRTTVANFRTAISSAGAIQMRNVTINTNEGAGNVLIPVARLGGTTGAASVNWATGTGTAIDGTDYTAGGGVLNWADGDGADKNISVPILQDAVADGQKTFTVVLSAPTGADLSATDTATVVIADDEPDAFPVSCAAPSGWSTPAGADAGWGVTTARASEGSCSFKSNTLAPPPTTDPGCQVAPIVFKRAQTQFTGTFLAGNIAFDARTSSEPGFDCLRFTIDGTQQNIGSCVGNGGLGQTPTSPATDTGWQHFSIPVSPGSHTLRFSYEIDCFTAGDNTAYVDALSMPIDPATIPTLNFSQPAYTAIEGGPIITVQVTRSGPTTGAIGVTWTTANGAAIAGQDFGIAGNAAQRTGILSWAAGDGTAKTITVGAGGLVGIINDTAFESSEDFTIALSAPTGGAVLGAQATTTVNITDNESTFAFDTATLNVSETGPNVTLNVTRTGSLATAATVNFAAIAGTATAASDFVAATGTISFAAGQSLKTITIGPTVVAAPYIQVINDAVIESPETFTVVLSSPTGGGVLGAPSTATVTIDSEDSGLAMAASTLTVAESIATAQVQVNRVGATTGPASVNYTFLNSTAINGTHYNGTPGTLNWAAGDGTPKTINVPIIDNAVVNAARIFYVQLSAPTGAVLGTPVTTVVTIADDDNTLQFNVATASVNESAGSVSLTVTRLGGAAGAASVNWSTTDGGAVAGSDFGTLGVPGPLGGVLNWAAGDAAAKTIVIPILNDTAIEGNETFTVTLSGASGTGASVGAVPTSTVTIVDNDVGVSFAQPTYSVIESGPMVSVMVNRIGDTSGAIGVTWTTANGSATAGQDFGTLGNAAQRTGMLAWAAGDATAKVITVGPGGIVPIINDTVFEPTENFTLTLSAPTGGAALGPTPLTTVSIVDDESTFAFDTPTLNVSEAGPNVTLNVTRTGSLATTATVNYTAVAGTATAGADFVAAVGTITFAAGQSLKTITIGPTIVAAPYIQVINDTVIEGPETFTVVLSAPTGGGQLGAPSTATITIDSDDRGIAMGAPTRSVAENAGAIDVSVSRAGPAAGAISVNYTFLNGTALNGTHYTGTPGTLNWADGDAAAKTIHVPIANDGLVNPNRTFTVSLSGAVGATIGAPASTAVTIADDDNTVQFPAATAAVMEGTPALSLTVTRIGGVANPASVNWATADGTALAGSDFGAAGVPAQVSGTLNWGAGDMASKTIAIPIINDSVVEGAKTFTVSLSAPSGATIGTIAAVNVTLTDNDAGVVFSTANYTVLENIPTVTLTVNRIGPTTAAATVTWTTANGNAIAGSDFGTPGNATQRTGSLSWAAGDATARSIVIPIINDAINDGADETFTVTLSNPSAGIVLGTPNVATVTILDDDVPPDTELAFSMPKYLVLENAGPAVLTVNRNDIGGGFGRAASVNFATTPGTALIGSDYTAVTGTLHWTAGDTAAKTISVPITNDSIAENPETFKVTLSAVTPGTRIATTEATVLIVDDDEVFPLHGAFPLNWVTPVTATAGWMVSNDPGAYEGVFALRTESIADSETAQTELTGTFVAGTISFRARISSEAGFDFLRFYVDGVKQAEWSGTANTAWQLYTTPLAAGVHTLRWSYEKDSSASLGQDAAWIDAVTLPAYTP